MSDENLHCIYKQLCDSYRAIDDFRAKLLALLPLATGTGIFLLYSKDVPPANMGFLGPIGLFGFIITLGLFAYEVYGIKKCGALIAAGKHIESSLGIDGQFACRPRGIYHGLINEPFAAGLIYPAVLAAWMFLGLAGLVNGSSQGASQFPISVFSITILVFLFGFYVSLRYNIQLRDSEKTDAAIMNINRCATVLATSQIEIAADPGTIWDIMTAVDHWPDWNPAVEWACLDGEFIPGSKFRWKASHATITSTLQQIRKPNKLAWTGKITGINAIHVWRLEPKDGKTIVITEESWDGLLSRIFRGFMKKKLKRSIDDGLKHLKAESERRSKGSTQQL
jgi:hypothetical protein